MQKPFRGIAVPAVQKAARFLIRKVEAFAGQLFPLSPVIEAMVTRPYELHLELTNICNANCVFCPYQVQTRPTAIMSDEVFEKAVAGFLSLGGGSVGLTPIVGDALIDPRFVARVRRLRSFPSIDRIWVTTNAILLEKHGIDAVLDSGLTAITISTSGFHEESYKRVYRSSAYQQMRRGVLALLEANDRRGRPVSIVIGLRTDRPLDAVMADPDFQPILAFEPEIDFTWAFTSAGGRIGQPLLPPGFRLRSLPKFREPCVQLFNGPIVLPDGTVMACSCVAAMDAVEDLGIGNVLELDLGEIWRGARLREIRSGFERGQPNPTCARCDMYRNLELYRTREGRERARVSRRRDAGLAVRREPPKGAFAGG